MLQFLRLENRYLVFILEKRLAHGIIACGVQRQKLEIHTKLPDT